MIYGFIIVSTLTFFFKAYVYEYKDSLFWSETIGCWFLSLLQLFRLFVGSKGNKTERSGTMVIFIILTLICGIGMAYFLQAQSYVIVYEFIFTSLILVVEVL